MEGWSSHRHRDISPLEFLAGSYPGLTRGELKIVDQNLYQRLRKDGTLSQVPLKTRFGCNPLRYCHETYPGITKKELRKLDRSLYQTLFQKKLLKFIPK